MKSHEKALLSMVKGEKERTKTQSRNKDKALMSDRPRLEAKYSHLKK